MTRAEWFQLAFGGSATTIIIAVVFSSVTVRDWIMSKILWIIRRRRIIRVGPKKRYKTIREGINKAKDGDTVLVYDGIYATRDDRNLDFEGKKIIVRSKNGPKKTEIDCGKQGRGFYFHSGENSESVVSGFTITDGLATDKTTDDKGGGGAIRCEDSSSPTIENNIITGNRAYEEGGGISCELSRPIIRNNRISENSGGAIYCGSPAGREYEPSALIINNEIFKNMGRKDIEGNDMGSAITCVRSSSKIINNTIVANSGSEFTIRSAVYSSPVIVNTIVWGNKDRKAIGGGSELETEVMHSDIEMENSKDVYPGKGNINEKPSFINDAGDDYHLKRNSPCIRTGIMREDVLDKDIDGNKRPSPPQMPNMGAYESRKY